VGGCEPACLVNGGIKDVLPPVLPRETNGDLTLPYLALVPRQGDITALFHPILSERVTRKQNGPFPRVCTRTSKVPPTLTPTTTDNPKMSATATMTVATPMFSSTNHHAMTACCPSCGYDMIPADETQAALLAAQKQISDLEAQVRLLNQKATAAVDRWADYEDELSRLRAAVAASPAPPMSPAEPVRQASPTRSSFLPVGAANRISALLSSRKSTPNLRTSSPVAGLPVTPTVTSPGYPSIGAFPPTSPTPSSATTEDLLEALTREQGLRIAAENRLSTTSKEVEELSVALFEQANEMVATERKARAKLEERVEVLEKRDTEKRRRLDRLEGAMNRIERVRSLLGEDNKVVRAPPQSKEMTSRPESRPDST
jgi:hypothetical protein